MSPVNGNGRWDAGTDAGYSFRSEVETPNRLLDDAISAWAAGLLTGTLVRP